MNNEATHRKEIPRPTLALSVILPVYNEEENIVELHQEITAVLDTMEGQTEVIYVDDGSSDGTLERLQDLYAGDDRVVVVEFRRNFGQTAAMAAGFELARGKVVIAMDADRQNDPADIPKLLAKVDEGYDLVSGWRYERKDGFLLRLLPSRIANKLISWATDVRLHDYGCSLKAFRYDVVKQISLYGEMHRFIPALASAVGVRIAEVKVNHRPRVAGESKYGISRTFRVLLDFFQRLSGMAGKDLVELLADQQDFPGMYIDIRCLSLVPAERLVNHHARMRQADTLAFGTPGKQ